MWENLKETLVIRGIKNTSENTLITDLMHGISLWRKWHLSLPPKDLPTQVESKFDKKK